MVKQRFVVAEIAKAVFVISDFYDVASFDSVADLFAAVVVFKPDDIPTGLFNDVKDIFFVFRVIKIEIFPVFGGEHTRDGKCRRRTAGCRIRNRDQIFFFLKQGIGFSFISV